MNTKAQEFSINSIILMIIGAMILVFLILGFTFGWEFLIPGLDKSEFTITKEECKMENKEIGYEQWAAEEKICNRTVTEQWSCPIGRGSTTKCFEDSDYEQKYLCNAPFCKIYIPIQEDVQCPVIYITVEDKEFHSITQEQIPIEVEREICNRVEVDEIVYQELDYNKAKECGGLVSNNSLRVVISFKDNSKINKITMANLTIYSEECEEREVYPAKTILKEELTIEWLDENCRMSEICETKRWYDSKGEYWHGDRCREGDFNWINEEYYRASKYQCEKYQVEVLE